MEKRAEEDVKITEEEEEEDKTEGSILSHTRVKRIIKSDPDTKQIANNAVQLIGRATEMFLVQFAKLVHQEAVKDHKKTIQYAHLARVVREIDELEFLNDIIPMQAPSSSSNVIEHDS